MYTCGPTVYQFAHIGNFRAYMTSDILVRLLKQQDFDVTFVMNITDVGHLVSDEDTGEDKLEKSAKKEGKTAWEVADFYTEAFLDDYKALNLTSPNVLAKATDHIPEQIQLIKKLEENGLTYVISDGVYFDTALLKNYGKLSTLDQIKEGARVEVNTEKHNPRDFALWKFSPKEEQRQMEWESPWGKGFPGWHIECSAMSMKYLGETLDIHTGGVDHISIHHTNEIAQSEGATHKKFVNTWIHTAFMLVSGEKMSKSKENTYRLYDLEKQGYTPMQLRYLYLNAHYRQEMNFTFPALDAAKNALEHLQNIIIKMREGEEGSSEYEEQFFAALHDDMNTPQAVAVMWDMLKAPISDEKKLHSLLKMDEILGLGLREYYEATAGKPVDVPQEVMDLIELRRQARKSKQFIQADHLRNKIKKLGFDIQDTDSGIEIKKL
jgi:cysteinyl-tRNA synthetase